MRSLRDDGVREIVERFVSAFERGDVEAIIALVTEDATFQLPPYAKWYRGRDAIADSWPMPGPRPIELRYLPARANGQLAVGAYALDPERESYLPIALDVLTLSGDRIAAITAFRTPDLPALRPAGPSSRHSSCAGVRPRARANSTRTRR